MEVKAQIRKFTCDGCNKSGVIENNKYAMPLHKLGTWFHLAQASCKAEDFCCLPCLYRRLLKIKFNLQTEITIELSEVRNA